MYINEKLKYSVLHLIRVFLPLECFRHAITVLRHFLIIFHNIVLQKYDESCKQCVFLKYPFTFCFHLSTPIRFHSKTRRAWASAKTQTFWGVFVHTKTNENAYESDSIWGFFAHHFQKWSATTLVWSGPEVTRLTGPLRVSLKLFEWISTDQFPCHTW